MLCRPSASLGSVIAVICVGLILLVYGEAEFNLAGFIIVMTASALSGLRWTITQVLLQGSSAHGVGDALLLLAMTAPQHSAWVLQSRFLLYQCVTCSRNPLVHQWGAAEYACVCVGSSGGPVEVLLSLTPGMPSCSTNQTSDAIGSTCIVPKVLISPREGVSYIVGLICRVKNQRQCPLRPALLQECLC